MTPTSLSKKETLNDEKPHVHAVFDEASLARQAEGLVVERTVAETQRLTRELIDSARAIHVNRMHEFEHQCGVPAPWRVLEAKIKKLVPTGLVFESKELSTGEKEFLGFDVTQELTTRIISRLTPAGTKEYVASYLMSEMVPEYTIILLAPKDVTVPDKRAFSARDFPRVIAGPDGKPIFDGPVPTIMQVDEPIGQIPGWRTVVYQLIAARVVSAHEAEEAFGLSDRATWAAKLGRKDLRDLPV